MPKTAAWLCVAVVILETVTAHHSHHGHHHHRDRDHHLRTDYCKEKCPLFDPPRGAVLLPGPTKAQFYKCNFGVGILFNCSPGTHFNPRIRVCDWPRDAGAVECRRSPDFEDEGSGEGSGDGDVFFREF